MEPIISSKTEEKKIKKYIINIIYIFDEYKKYEGKMEMKFREDEEKRNLNIISFEEIKKKIEYFLYEKQKKYKDNNEENEEELEFFDINSNNIIYEYIRYFNGEGWALLEENGFIIINEELNLDILKIMIKAKILSGEENKIHKRFENMEKEINKIKTDLDDINKGYINYYNYLPFNSIILIANPLIDEEGKEFRTMNDFNIIPATLYNLFKEYGYLKYTQFGILTKRSFEEVLKDKQLDSFILHLICKSTYKKKDNETNNILENKKSDDLVNLIFEKEDSKGEFIDKIELNKIFSDEIKENIKKITLIISTQLSQDIYNIFYNFGFKNIIIQHTTPADVDFIAKVNLRFYENLIINKIKNINDIYNDALNFYSNKDTMTFCCCFHEHNINCNFIKNIQNELYNEDNKEKYTLDELKETLPHFCHLKPRCAHGISPKCDFPDDFCYHVYFCLTYLNIKDKVLVEKRGKTTKSKENIYSTCCCYDKKINKEDNIIHNINTIFRAKYFNSESINDKNSIIKINIQKNYIPQYEKMIFLVGKNKNILEVMEILNSDKQYLNIYGDTIEDLKIFINVLIEYYQERNEEKKNKHIILDEFNIQNFKDELKYNIKYFFYIQDPNYIQIIEDLKTKYKIILFSEKPIDKGFKSIKINPKPLESVNNNIYIPNYYVKYQDKYSAREIWNND